jgi:hypothetical protein
VPKIRNRFLCAPDNFACASIHDLTHESAKNITSSTVQIVARWNSREVIICDDFCCESMRGIAISDEPSK